MQRTSTTAIRAGECVDGCVVARGVFDAVKRDVVSVEPRPVAPGDASGLPQGGVGRRQHLALIAVDIDPHCAGRCLHHAPTRSRRLQLRRPRRQRRPSPRWFAVVRLGTTPRHLLLTRMLPSCSRLLPGKEPRVDGQVDDGALPDAAGAQQALPCAVGGSCHPAIAPDELKLAAKVERVVMVQPEHRGEAAAVGGQADVRKPLPTLPGWQRVQRGTRSR